MTDKVIYGVFDNSMWQLDVELQDHEGKKHWCTWIRCTDDKYRTLISRRIRKFEKDLQNFRVFLDGVLVHTSNFK